MTGNTYANSGFSANNRSADSNDSHEDIYANEDVLDTRVTKIHKDPMTSGPNTAEGRRYRLTAVCVLLLLCVLLLTAVTVLWIKFTTERNLSTQLQQERDELQKKMDVLDEQDEVRWENFGSRLYYFSEIKNWTEARQDCRERGADLVIIDTEEKQDFIVKQLQGRQFWIGLNDRETEGTWKWVDGTPLGTEYWSKSQPDDYKNDEDCAEIGFPDVSRWNDRACSYKQGWMCETSVGSV